MKQGYLSDFRPANRCYCPGWTPQFFFGRQSDARRATRCVLQRHPLGWRTKVMRISAQIGVNPLRQENLAPAI
jgi:hypothetical protein